MTERATSERTVAIPALATAEDVATLERELGKLEGVIEARIDLERRQVRIEWTEATLDWAAIRWFLEEIGYPPEGEPGGG